MSFFMTFYLMFLLKFVAYLEGYLKKIVCGRIGLYSFERQNN